MDFELRLKSSLNVEEVKRRVRAAKVARVAKCAALVEADAKRSLSRGGAVPGTAKPGEKKVPTVYKSGPAGQPPRLRSGNLRASIKYGKTPIDSYVVGPTITAWYGRVHEFGVKILVTRKMHYYLGLALGIWVPIGTTITIPKRPYMGPALRNMASKFPSLFADLPLGGTAG